MESITPLRVRYAETDAMGIVHHAAYLVWMELGRSDFLRRLGHGYPEWEKRGVMLSVAELRVRYRAPARYDEALEVRTRLKEAGRRKVVFAYTILREGTRLAEGESIHVVTGPTGRACVMPDDLLHRLSGALPPKGCQAGRAPSSVAMGAANVTSAGHSGRCILLAGFQRK